MHTEDNPILSGSLDGNNHKLKLKLPAIPWVPIFIGNPGFLLEFTSDVMRGRNDYNKSSCERPNACFSVLI